VHGVAGVGADCGLRGRKRMPGEAALTDARLGRQ
jgi:hypothetical protein